ncbi:MAG: hypothetical protein A2660_01135 [Candidatus Doudnabacteria bacterium RIFCSPHIGHO2_01_FULL_45_18]|uniref:Undecaprenyl-phosphate alpha-N-acetylglucosaminyl 1-phosphate transferase n=1 Tax=Candidatus Doudnabacteria bacterium RIFCSPHIGHO2_01_FULL_45_18 TaxID=1817823 RepID=A0A1F5NRJ2_9BACT|nr:MAG: hypothetical protein A2660_01135 [Candidatus Doudnabacteria bacterium RIFCSPHIGHO2_01_FULL_45_18]
MQTIYIISFVAAFVVSWLCSLWVIRMASRAKILDVPDMERKFHQQATPTLGGLAVFLSFFLVTLAVGILGGHLLDGNIPFRVLLAIWVGGVVLMVGGYLDDRYQLPPYFSIIFPVVSSLLIVVSGVKAVSVHNPFTNNVIVLDQLSFLSGLVVFVWTMTLTYATKLLDGMDGLVTGIAAIGALVLFGISLTPQVMQQQTAILAITLAGSLLGFLVLNFYPAKIFLGEGGSTFAGFMLAILAVVSGGKIATALLVMGIPLLDMTWVIIQRLQSGRSPFSADRRHLHYKLLEIGFSEPKTVLFLYVLTAAFGLSALFLQSRGKLIALVILFAVMLVIIATMFSLYKKKRNKYE